MLLSVLCRSEYPVTSDSSQTLKKGRKINKNVLHGSSQYILYLCPVEMQLSTRPPNHYICGMLHNRELWQR